MGTVTLTGRDAAEALALYTRLGATGARFDHRRLAVAMRTRVGRLRVAAGLAQARRALVAAVGGAPTSPRGTRRENGSRRFRRAPTDSGSSDRPRLVPCEFGYVHAELGIPAALCSDCSTGPCVRLDEVKRRYRL